MATLTKRTPTTRTYDTTLGKFFGWLNHESFFWGKEKDCNAWTWFLPDWFPISTIKGLIKSIFQKSYDDGYQTAYNEGADYGNSVHKEVFGWVDKAKTDLTSSINKVKTDLEKIISDIKTKIGSIDSLLTDARTKLSALDTKIVDIDRKVADAKALIDRAVADAKSALDRANKSLSEIDTAKTKINSMFSDLSTKTSQINELFERVKKIEAQLGVPATAPTKTIWDILLGR